MGKNSTRHLGWFIVGFSFITLALVYGVWYSFSVFFVALLKEFGWSRSVGAGAFSIFIILSGVIGPYAGNRMYSVGPQKVILVGSLLLGVGLALCSITKTWWQFYIFFSLITAIGLGTSGWVPNVALIQQWFKEKRGLPFGIISSGIGVGILVCVPLIQSLITWVGWRMAYQMMAIFIPLIIISMMMVLLRRPPPRISSYGGIKSPSIYVKDPLIVNEQWTSRSWTVKQALGTKEFWLLAFSAFLGSFIIQSVFAHQVAFFVDHGVEALFASYLVGIVGMVSLGGKILWGTLSDKIGREMTYTLGAICSLLGLISLILYSMFSSPVLTYSFPIFFGMGYASTAALPPLITADFFEGKAYGGIFGWLMMVVGIGGAFGAWFAGFLYDHLGSYVPIFAMMMIGVFFSCLSIWWAGPRKIRLVPGKKVDQSTGHS
ncbi:MAG: MFS transporter [Syntrophaceae bacterium]|nr:MFS transporter [Syntrophaceae bacterium]